MLLPLILKHKKANFLTQFLAKSLQKHGFSSIMTKQPKCSWSCYIWRLGYEPFQNLVKLLSTIYSSQLSHKFFKHDFEMLQFHEFFHNTNTSSTSDQNQNFVSLNFKEAFQTIYDYEAQDDDEVSFRDSDLIINCVKIS